MLVQIVKDWDKPDIMRQTPGSRGDWNNIQFTTKDTEKCDFVVVLNKVPHRINVNCPPSHIWAFMQEPYIPIAHEWMHKGHNQFAKVFTHDIFKKDQKYIKSFPLLPWHIDKTYDELKSIQLPQKTKIISWVTSNKMSFPGHKKRMVFLDFIHESNLQIDIFGKGISFIEDKWDGLAPYKYSLAIENSTSEDYWTEKIADCFLSYTLPIYYGCTNLEEYFPADSFIRIDISNPEESLRKIIDTINNNEWEKRLNAIKKARNLILDKYNFFPELEHLISLYHNQNEENTDQKVILEPYVYKRSFKNKVLVRLNKIKNIFVEKIK